MQTQCSFNGANCGLTFPLSPISLNPLETAVLYGALVGDLKFSPCLVLHSAEVISSAFSRAIFSLLFLLQKSPLTANLLKMIGTDWEEQILIIQSSPELLKMMIVSLLLLPKKKQFLHPQKR